MEEAFEKVDNGEGEPERSEHTGESSVLKEASRTSNWIKYAVEGNAYGTVQKGDAYETWQEALTCYLLDFPLRNALHEVLVLTMIVNGQKAVPVWEQAFFDYLGENKIQVRSVRDPRDPSDQVLKG